MDTIIIHAIVIYIILASFRGEDLPSPNAAARDGGGGQKQKADTSYNLE
jgi:hypothetical protein